MTNYFQQFIDKICKSIPNGERYKVIYYGKHHDLLEASTTIKDLANLFKAGLKISPHKYQFLRDHLTDMGLIFMFIEG